MGKMKNATFVRIITLFGELHQNNASALLNLLTERGCRVNPINNSL